jgi:hypothetical protein
MPARPRCVVGVEPPDALSSSSPEHSVSPFRPGFQLLVRSTGRLYSQYCHMALSP